MNISKKTRYASRALIELGLLYEKKKKPVTLTEISKNQKIPVRYLENIFNALVNAKILHGVRGKGGGFILSKPVHNIFLSDVIQIFDPPLKNIECVDDVEKCSLYNTCVMRDIWSGLAVHLIEYLGKYSLQDLMDKARKDENMFYI